MNREAIARIIDPDGWEKFNGLPANYRGPVVLPPTEALAKADAILALPVGRGVEVTDEMVERALAIFYDRMPYISSSSVRAALEAALSPRSSKPREES